jgi:hypothetical protein
MLPSLWSGFMMDDYYYVLEAEGFPLVTGNDGRFFAFYLGDEEVTSSLARQGLCPWWIDDSLHLAFLRPLSSLLLRIDTAVFGRWAVGHHLHSLLWWALALLVSGVFLRRLLPGSIGTLALLLFALDESHILPAGWISNRSALVALTAMLLALWAHIRWREEHWRPGRFLSPLGVVLGLLAGEVGAIMLSYFLAYELWGAPASSRRMRLLAMLRFLIPASVYLLAYWLLGYGAARGGLYVDPVRDPLGFLAVAAARIPILLAGGTIGFSSDFGITYPQLKPALIAAGCVGVILLGSLLRASWRRCDELVRRRLRWLLPGGLLALVPAAAVYPSDRMFLASSLGLVAAVAVILQQAWLSWRRRYGRRQRLLIAGGAFLAIIHLLWAPLVVELYQKSVTDLSRATLALTKSQSLEDAFDREVVILLAPDCMVGLFLPLMLPFTHGDALQSWRPLTMAPYDHWLRRPEPRTLELEVASGGVMLGSWAESLYRGRKHMLLPGDVLDRGLLRVEILEGNEAGPTRVAFHFARDLDDPSLVLLTWEDGDLQKAALPAVGSEVLLKRTLGPAGY